MPLNRRLLAQDDNDDNQWLKIDYSNRYIVNDMNDWQFLFGPNSLLTNSVQILKISGQLDTSDLNSVRFIAYLYNPVSGSIDNAATCVFKVYRVTTPNWTENLIATFNGILQSNQYFFSDQLLNSLSPAELDGDNSLMIEVVVTRLSYTFRDRIYLNHLGIYDSFIRLKQEVEFLDITKMDE